MAQTNTAKADQSATKDTATKPATAKRVRLKNTKAANGKIGDIATPLQKDAAKWRAIGWVDAD